MDVVSNKRAKYSGSSFLSLYKSLYEAPDPVAAISASIEQSNAGGGQSSKLELENQKFKQELKELDEELAKLKNHSTSESANLKMKWITWVK
jgi:hypothetical protein